MNLAIVRELQIKGAMCVDAFTRHFGIKHSAITELVDHLLEVESEDVLAWERSGACLALNGRGDPVPSELRDLVPPQIRADFFHLVDCAVEIGLVDLFGAATSKPRDFLDACIAILKKHAVPLPP